MELFLLVVLGVLIACAALGAWLAQRHRPRPAHTVQVACPSCHGSGRCRQCGGMGTLGLMGKPCPACGGGLRSERGRTVTVSGSGRCTACGGQGRVYRDDATGQEYPIEGE